MENLHIMPYTFHDLMYAGNRRSSYTYVPSALAIQGIKHIIRYLVVIPQRTIIYTSGLDCTTIHELCQEFSPYNFHSENKSNELVDLADGGEVHSPNDKKTIACVVPFIYGVPAHWSYRPQTASAYHPIDSED